MQQKDTEKKQELAEYYTDPSTAEDMDESEREAHSEQVRKQIMDRKSSEKMGTAPVGRLLFEMAWPAVVSMLINALYNIVDSIFVARLSTTALTAVSLVMPLQLLIIAFNVGSGVGVNSLIARRLGARRYREADQAASTSLLIAVCNAALFFLVGAFAAAPFVGLYTDDPVLASQAVSYLRIVCMLCVFSSIDIQIEKVLQATGNMVAPMIISVSGAVTNIILDPILIFGLLGAPRLGVTGAAAATVIGQFVAMCAAIFTFFRKKRDVRIRLRGFRLDWHVIGDIYAVGAPSIVMQAIGSVMQIGYNGIIAENTVAVAVLGVYFKVQSFVFMPVFGLNQGAMPIIGYNYGARNRKRLLETYKKGLVAAVVIMAAGFLVFQLLPDRLLRLFNDDPELLRMGVPAFREISLAFLPAAFGIMTSTLFQGTGHGVYSLFASLLRQLVGILPLAWLLYQAGGAAASWYSFPIAEVIGFSYSVIMLRHLYVKELKKL